jgi:hypothetical protein
MVVILDEEYSINYYYTAIYYGGVLIIWHDKKFYNFGMDMKSVH